MQGKFEEVPLEELTTPKGGYVCVVNEYWLIGPKGGALKYTLHKVVYPQCNANELIVQRLLKGKHGDAVGYQLIPVAYWPNQY